jgi:hypothetical protein
VDTSEAREATADMSLQSFSRTNGTSRPAGRKYNIESHYLSVAANIFESSSRQLTSSYSRFLVLLKREWNYRSYTAYRVE